LALFIWTNNLKTTVDAFSGNVRLP